MKPTIWTWVVLLLLIVAAVGCSSPQPAVPTAAPSPTNPPPTVAPSPTAPPPTATSAPTAAPASAATAATATTAPTQPPAGSGTTLAQALSNSKKITTFRLDLSMSGKGDLSGANLPIPTNQEITLIGMAGELNGRDLHITLKGLVATFLGGDPDKGMEVMSVGGKNYLHGPAPTIAPGATEDKWYILSQDQSSVTQLPLQPSEIFDDVGAQSAQLDVLKKGAPESLDGKQCDTYAGDKDATIKLFQSLTQSAPPTPDDTNQIDDASSKFWVCDDGFFHQMQINVTGHAKDKPAQTSTFSLRFHMWDHNGAIKITAPENALPLTVPGLSPTATPAR